MGFGDPSLPTTPRLELQMLAKTTPIWPDQAKRPWQKKAPSALPASLQTKTPTLPANREPSFSILLPVLRALPPSNPMVTALPPLPICITAVLLPPGLGPPSRITPHPTSLDHLGLISLDRRPSQPHCQFVAPHMPQDLQIPRDLTPMASQAERGGCLC